MLSIRLDNISKQYRVGAGDVSAVTLRESVMRVLRAPFRVLHRKNRQASPARHIWALENVSFEIMQGEVVGIIGRNGAGKSTLLKILARITEPTSGSAELRGRVGSLLNVGTGFHSELTGWENIYLNGAILGMSRAEVRRKMDRIVDFAGVGEFLDTPIKHYSDGMRVRLAFAVAAHLDTEILLADEVLAVGDAAFQKKCIDEMGSLAHQGRTVLFVSHNMAAIGELCKKTILLDKGRLEGFGSTHEIVKQYLSEFSSSTPNVVIKPPDIDRGVAISKITITSDSGEPTGELDWRFPFSIQIEFKVSQPQHALSIGVTLVNQLGIRALFSWIAFQQPFSPGSYLAEGRFSGEFLNPGRYYVDVSAELYGIEAFHVVHQAASFEMLKTTGEFGYDLETYGVLFARILWHTRSLAEIV